MFIIETITPPDSHYLNAAIGWMELGNVAEAEIELAKIAPPLMKHPALLDARWQICAQKQDWTACLEIANQVVHLFPEQVIGYIHRSYALRRADGGGLKVAYDALLEARERFPGEPLVCYNLACYQCKMGNKEQASDLISDAMKMGDKNVLKLMALEDPDLELLWPMIGQM